MTTTSKRAQDIADAKQNVKDVRKHLKECEQAIKEAEGPSRKEKIITAILNGADVTTRAVCSVTHFGLTHAIHKVENAEATMTKWAQGVDPEETIRERRRRTAEIQLKMNQSINDLKERIENWNLLGNSVDEEIIKEVVTPTA
jgi:hypothetical protein